MNRRWHRLLYPGMMTTIMLAILIGLGTWQIYRLHWKERILAQIATAESGPPVPLASNPPPFAKVAVTGTFDWDRAAWYSVDVRDTAAGPTMGSFQIVPLMRPDAPPVLVDRGWVPDKPPNPPINPTGTVTVQGYVLRPSGPGWFSAPNDVAGRHFYTLDLATIAAALHISQPAPFVVIAIGAVPDGVSPVPAQHLPRPPNNHLSYVITWYGLAAALLVTFTLWARGALRS